MPREHSKKTRKADRSEGHSSRSGGNERHTSSLIESDKSTIPSKDDSSKRSAVIKKPKVKSTVTVSHDDASASSALPKHHEEEHAGDPPKKRSRPERSEGSSSKARSRRSRSGSRDRRPPSHSDRHDSHSRRSRSPSRKSDSHHYPPPQLPLPPHEREAPFPQNIPPPLLPTPSGPQMPLEMPPPIEPMVTWTRPPFAPRARIPRTRYPFARNYESFGERFPGPRPRFPPGPPFRGGGGWMGPRFSRAQYVPPPPEFIFELDAYEPVSDTELEETVETIASTRQSALSLPSTRDLDLLSIDWGAEARVALAQSPPLPALTDPLALLASLGVTRELIGASTWAAITAARAESDPPAAQMLPVDVLHATRLCSNQTHLEALAQLAHPAAFAALFYPRLALNLAL